MAGRADQPEETFESLVESGIDEDVARIVQDQLRVRELERYSQDIQERLKVKSELLVSKATELHRALASMVGLSHTIPTEIDLDLNGIQDTLDLSFQVTRSEEDTLVRLVWKTHNIHLIESLPEGFLLGDLNMGRREERSVEVQIPLVSMVIRRRDPERRRLFGQQPAGDEAVSLRLSLNRSWLEGKPIASDGVLDSAYDDPLAFLDLLSDQAGNAGYTLVVRLIGVVDQTISAYLANKRAFIDGIEF